jgi:hypothetical protein
MTAEAALAVGRPHSRIFFGILLAFVGLGLEAIGFALTTLTSDGSTQTVNDLVIRVGIGVAVESVAIACTGIGLFLVFFHVARIRPATKPWTSGAAFVLLATGLAGALLRALQFGSWYGLVSGSVSGSATTVETTITILRGVSALQFAVGLAETMAIIVGLFGLTRPSNLG